MLPVRCTFICWAVTLATLPACSSNQQSAWAGPPHGGNERESNPKEDSTGPRLGAVREAPAWDAVFGRTDGWTGGDADYSVDLGDGRTLWLFADSWIGPVRHGRHAPGSHLVNNAAAVHPTPRPGYAPDPVRVRFFWGPDDDKGRPTPWLAPPASANSTSWYWVADGVVAPGPAGKDRLGIFLWHIARRSDKPTVWNFKSVGGALVIIDNPHEPVETWNKTFFTVPHAISADAARGDPNRFETSWGSEVLLVPDDAGVSGETLYIFGVREAARLDKHLLLARAPADRVENFSTWQFRTKTGWSSDVDDADPLTDYIVNELSIDRVEIHGVPVWIMVHSEPLLGPGIVVRTAPRPEGPWSRPTRIFRVRGVEKNETYFTYAAKGHAHLSGPGHLLISYIINAQNFKAMVGDASIYRPRFLRLALDRIPLPPAPPLP